MEEYQDLASTLVNKDKISLKRRTEPLDTSFSKTKSNDMIVHIAMIIKSWKGMESKLTNRQLTFHNMKIVINFKMTSPSLKEDTIQLFHLRKRMAVPALKTCCLPPWNLAIHKFSSRIATHKELLLSCKI